MGLKLPSTVEVKGKMPLDERLMYPTKEAMKAVKSLSLYEGMIAYCTEDNNRYEWRSTNEEDPTTGKWRVVYVLTQEDKNKLSQAGAPTVYTGKDGISVSGTTIGLEPNYKSLPDTVNTLSSTVTTLGARMAMVVVNTRDYNTKEGQNKLKDNMVYFLSDAIPSGSTPEAFLD